LSTTSSHLCVPFDVNGNFVDRAGFDGFLAAAGATDHPTDIFFFAHGWSNNFAEASQSYSAILARIDRHAAMEDGGSAYSFRRS
jgi:hypothetical protein